MKMDDKPSIKSMLFLARLCTKQRSIINTFIIISSILISIKMKKKILNLTTGFLLLVTSGFSQVDTINENFNGICEQTLTPGRTYSINYTGTDGILWNINTLYSSSSWWGGIDDEGEAFSGIHCGSLQWDEDNSGYARAEIPKGIKTLSFQMKYGFQLVGGYVKVMIDGEEAGRTDTLDDKEIHTFTFDINTPGPLDLELIPVVETDKLGGIVVDNISIITSDQSKPFFRIDKLDEFDPNMDTLWAHNDTIELYFYAEHCLMVNGEFVDYFDLADDVELTVGSVIDLTPGDSCNLYYWGSVTPGVGSTGGDLNLGVSLPVNTNEDSIALSTLEGEDTMEGILSFLNGNIDFDLVVFKLPDAKHEYRINFTYDSYKVQTDTSSTDTTTAIQNQLQNTSLKFYPNPVQNHAWFQTSKELSSYEVMDMQGRVLFKKTDPPLTGEGYYRLDLEQLKKGVCIIRFIYTDRSMDAVRVILN